ncbi:MAG TPA: alpha/beta hydrolase [Phenylobacterium sp.]|jgi:pimeloyl-ACP methyl ester carboxylesterase|uniref:alpha/beta fold hydrolase n=1 Tax=Phenylobacterium sp. TaxID=1871053 RepID=UPI002D39D618|nr:alpha/beta hydrolase [Phenylobacterium sp.]HZZ68913.1 alpha/beta hydrolase [Phenylobacterium sp.]
MERRTALLAGALLFSGAGATAAPTRPSPRDAIDAHFPYLEAGRRTRLYYKDWGEGETTVLFVHGWPMNAAMWDYQLLHLAQSGMRAIAYDQRGCGKSTDPGRGYDFDTLADDLHAVIRQLGLRKVVLVGHSIGCGQIVRYLTRYGGERVSRILLLSASLPFVQQAPDNPDGLDAKHFDSVRHQIASDVGKWLARAGKLSFAPETSPEMFQWAVRLCQDNSLYAMTATSHIDVETDFRPELARLAIRTLVAHGDADLTCKFETTGQRLAALIPGAQLKVYPGAGHMLFLTQMGAFNADLLAFAKA